MAQSTKVCIVVTGFGLMRIRFDDYWWLVDERSEGHIRYWSRHERSIGYEKDP
jgi:hypothetical protein